MSDLFEQYSGLQSEEEKARFVEGLTSAERIQLVADALGESAETAVERVRQFVFAMSNYLRDRRGRG